MHVAPEGTTDPAGRIVAVDFHHYKALEQFTLDLAGMNVLVGPNNCGKSTIIGAFRLLSVAIRRARSRRPEPVRSLDDLALGWELPLGQLPISTENLRTDYVDGDSFIRFRFANGNLLMLAFPADGGAKLIPASRLRSISSPAIFKQEFPASIACIPILGPIEHREELVRRETVERYLLTHRASRHFRNYWHHFPEGFERFAEMVRQTWPGMSINAPRIENQDPVEVFMFAEEDRMARELYWCGFGFQTWCQLLTHLSRNAGASLVVVDEPEVYLHADVQRQLTTILRDLGPPILMATHSTEILAEAEVSDIVYIDKRKSGGQRFRKVEDVQSVFKSLGSVHNITLVRAVRTRRILYVEGSDDLAIFQEFGGTLGLRKLKSGAFFTAVESGGHGSWKEIAGVARRMADATGFGYAVGAIYDRDYRCQDEIQEISGRLSGDLSYSAILGQKEVENYLLVPDALDRLVAKRSREGVLRPLAGPAGRSSAELLMQITDPMRSDLLAKYLDHEREYFRRKGNLAGSNAPSVIAWFDSTWADLSGRLRIVPGKTVLAAFRAGVQSGVGVSFSDRELAREISVAEIPDEIVASLTRLEKFCSSVVN